MKKLLTIALTLAMVLSLAACGSSSPSSDSGAEDDSTAAEGEEAPMKVAMCLSGDINDAGWCQSAYEGLMDAKETYGVEVAYTESIDQVNYESSIREYAAAGYDLILAVGAEFTDACLAVGTDFPDVMIANFNGSTAQEPNVATYRYTTTETGFVAGVIAALLSDSGVVGYVAGSSAAHIQDAVAAFKDGVAYIDPSYTALEAYTDSMTDVALADETAKAMIDQGADVLLGNANTASLGVIQACEEAGIKAVGCISDQYEVAPETVYVSVVQDNHTMVMSIIQTALEGNFAAEVNLFGMDSGAIYVSDWHGHDADISQEDMDKIEEVIAAIKDGSLKEQGILRKTSFE